MMNKTNWLLAVIAFLLIRGATGALNPEYADQPEYAPGIILVGLKDWVRPDEMVFSRSSYGVKPVINEQLAAINIMTLRVPAGEEDQFIASTMNDPRIAFAEKDYRIYIDSFEQASIPRIPNDPYFNSQWPLMKIDATGAWGYNIGSSAVTIAMIDSGIQLNHPDLTAKLWSNSGEIPSNALDDDGNGKIDDIHGWHFYHKYTSEGYIPAEDNMIADDLGHGTHVAGIAAATSDNEIGIAGISWGSTIMPVKVINEYGDGWYSDITAGIIYAVDNGARIINLSLGGEKPGQTLKAAIDYALEHGAVVVAAAGNTGGAVLYPASYDDVIAVAATDKLDQRAYYSNYGPEIDLAAPGSEIYSTWYRSNYFTRSGTSMAAPHVSGLIALMYSQRMELTKEQIIELLCASADDIGPTGKDIYTGCGRVNAGKAMQLVSEPTTRVYKLIFPLIINR